MELFLEVKVFLFDGWFWYYFFVVGSTFDSYAFLRCVVLILVVVAGGIFGSHCLHSMLDRLLGCCRILVSTVIHWELMTYSEFFREPTSSTRRLSLSRLGAGEGYALSFNSKRQPYSRDRVFKLMLVFFMINIFLLNRKNQK